MKKVDVVELFKKQVELLPDGFYFKHFIIASVIALLLMSNKHFSLDVVFLCSISAIIYPFSMFVVEKVLEYFPVEDNWFNKIITCLVSFVAGFIIAPLGVLYLNYKKKNEQTDLSSQAQDTD